MARATGSKRRDIYRNSIDKMVVMGGYKNAKVAELCGYSENRVVALRRSNTYPDEVYEHVRDSLGIEPAVCSCPGEICETSLDVLADKIASRLNLTVTVKGRG